MSLVFPSPKGESKCARLTHMAVSSCCLPYQSESGELSDSTLHSDELHHSSAFAVIRFLPCCLFISPVHLIWSVDETARYLWRGGNEWILWQCSSWNCIIIVLAKWMILMLWKTKGINWLDIYKRSYNYFIYSQSPFFNPNWGLCWVRPSREFIALRRSTSSDMTW